jgi:peptidoglycan/xylan/chitin deacetylase (PgdA/CDA1 family)
MSETQTLVEPSPFAKAIENSLPPQPSDFSRGASCALQMYRFATWPIRQACDGYLRWKHRAPVLSFFYHHVGEQAVAPWSIDFDTFRRQIDWLAERYDMVDYAEAQRRLTNGHSQPCATITFDDGYAANCDRALPYLVSQKIPCTYFATSWHIATGTPFAHDVARGLPLAVNTPAQIRELADAGIEIGAHTRRHHHFTPDDTPDVLHDEIVGSKCDLEQLTGHPVRYFAFPYGTPAAITPAAVRTIQQAGYDGYCSAYGGYNLPPADPYHMQRIHGDREMPRFYNWATLDPRKLGIHWQPAQAPDAQTICS